MTSPSFDLEPLLTSREAAEVLGVERRTISVWVKRRHIHPARKMPGVHGGYVFTLSEVERVKTAPRPRRSLA